MTHELGKVFTLRNLAGHLHTVKVTAQSGCTGCYLYHASCSDYRDQVGVCSDGERTDHHSVIFKEVSEDRELSDSKSAPFKVGDRVVIDNLRDPRMSSSRGEFSGKIGHIGVITSIHSGDDKWIHLNPTCLGNAWLAENLRHAPSDLDRARRDWDEAAALAKEQAVQQAHERRSCAVPTPPKTILGIEVIMIEVPKI